MATNQRVPVATLSGPERLRPSAGPTQSYVQPQRQTSAVEFMRALGSLNPALNQFADKLADDEREKQEAAVAGKIGGMTFDEFKAARAKDPSLGITGKWARAALDKQYGTRMGHEVRRRAEEELATADLTETNPEEFVARHTSEAVAELGENKFARAGFDQTTNGLGDKVRDKVNEHRIGKTVEVRNENATENFLGTVEWAASELADPEALVHVVREQYQQNRELLGISYAEQDKLIANVMKTMAQRPGMESYIEALGNLDRDKVRLSTKLGPAFEAMKASAEATTQNERKDGLQLGVADYTLAADRGELNVEEFTAWVDPNIDVLGGSFKASIIARNEDAQRAAAARAQAALQSVAKETQLVAMTPSLVELAMTGHVAEVQDVSFSAGGKTYDYTQDELKEHALRSTANQIELDGQRQGLDPQSIRKNVIAMYGRNGETDPLTESRVSALLNASVAGGDLPQTTLDYLPELQAAYDVAPEMVQRLAGSDADKMYLSAIFVGMDTGLTAVDAVRNAAWRRDNADRIVLPTGRDRQMMVDAVASRLSKNGGERSMLDPFIGERLDYYAMTGATGKDLEKRVSRSIERTHAFVGGRLVDVTGTNMPASQTLPIFADATEALKRAKPAYAKETITYQPSRRGSSTFRAVTALGEIIPGTDRTWAEMQRLHGEAKTQRLQANGNDAATRRSFRDSILGAAGEAAAANIF